VLWQWRLEWAVLRQEWALVALAVLVEYFHMFAHSLVYYIQVSAHARIHPNPCCTHQRH
jgi:hypothetical protein